MRLNLVPGQSEQGGDKSLLQVSKGELVGDCSDCGTDFFGKLDVGLSLVLQLVTPKLAIQCPLVLK